MKHLGTETLRTRRLILRRFTAEDAPAAYRNWTSDGEVTKYLTWPTHNNQVETQAILEDWVTHYMDPAYYQWAIVPKGNCNEPIGSIAVVSLDARVEKAAIGYCIGKKWWRQGITSEALAAVIDFLLHKVELRRVEAYHDARNPHSGGVMKKCGMTFEGTLRASAKNNQGICDACWYGILKDEK